MAYVKRCTVNDSARILRFCVSICCRTGLHTFRAEVWSKARQVFYRHRGDIIMMRCALSAFQIKCAAICVRRPENPARRRLCMGRAGNGGVSPIEVDHVSAESSASDPEPPKPFMSTVQTHSDNRSFQVRMGKMQEGRCFNRSQDPGRTEAGSFSSGPARGRHKTVAIARAAGGLPPQPS